MAENKSSRAVAAKAKPAKKKDWTIMVYMAGDNNLSIDLVYALREIQEAMRDKAHRLNLLVYYDGSVIDSPTQYCDFSDPQRPVTIPASSFRNPRSPRRVSQGGINQNAATMSALYQFADWCLGKGGGRRNRRASNYALIVSGHGSGFQNLSFLKDDRAKYYMTIPKFRETLSWIQKDLLGERPFDLIGFDNCVMGMLEIGHELKDHASIMVGSEGYIPNAGWTYEHILKDLLSKRRLATPAAVGVSVVESFIGRQAEFAMGGVSVDIAAWDLERVRPVTAAVQSLGEILYRGMLMPDLCTELKPILLQSHYECQSYMFEQNVDLKDFCKLLSQAADERLGSADITLRPVEGKTRFDLKTELRKRCRVVIKAVENCVLLSGFSGGKYQYSNGISIFFPWTAAIYGESARNYRKLKFARRGTAYWDRFLSVYLEAVSRRESKPSSIKETAPIDFTSEIKLAEILRGRTTDGILASVVESQRTELNPVFRVEGNVIFRVEGNPVFRVEGNTVYRVEGNPVFRVEGNTVYRVEGNPVFRVEGNTVFRVEGNPVFRVEGSSNDRVVNNTANRVLGAMGLTMVDFKNVAEPWYIYGFSKKTRRGAFPLNMTDRSLF